MISFSKSFSSADEVSTTTGMRAVRGSRLISRSTCSPSILVISNRERPAWECGQWPVRVRATAEDKIERLLPVVDHVNLIGEPFLPQRAQGQFLVGWIIFNQ